LDVLQSKKVRFSHLLQQHVQEWTLLSLADVFAHAIVVAVDDDDDDDAMI